MSENLLVGLWAAYETFFVCVVILCFCEKKTNNNEAQVQSHHEIRIDNYFIYTIEYISIYYE